MIPSPATPTIPSFLGTDPSPASPTVATTSRHHALSSRISSVLSLSYVDTDVDSALQTLDLQGTPDLAELRQKFRQSVQRQVIDENAVVVRDFSQVSKVG